MPLLDDYAIRYYYHYAIVVGHAAVARHCHCAPLGDAAISALVEHCCCCRSWAVLIIFIHYVIVLRFTPNVSLPATTRFRSFFFSATPRRYYRYRHGHGHTAVNVSHCHAISRHYAPISLPVIYD